MPNGGKILYAGGRPMAVIIARKYLTITATSERVFSVTRMVVDKISSALTAEMIDTLVF